MILPDAKIFGTLRVFGGKFSGKITLLFATLYSLLSDNHAPRIPHKLPREQSGQDRPTSLPLETALRDQVSGFKL